MMMGRGIVHPVDVDHGNNPPSHPELLDEMAKEFVEHKYDLKWLVREIALSDAYQRSSETPAGLDDPPADRYLIAILKPLTPEQFAYAVMQATGHTDADLAAAFGNLDAPVPQWLIGACDQVVPQLHQKRSRPGFLDGRERHSVDARSAVVLLGQRVGRVQSL